MDIVLFERREQIAIDVGPDDVPHSGPEKSGVANHHVTMRA